MKTTKHTPGPWTLKKLDARDSSIQIGNVQELIITTVPANAALIAAAPELLEALESILEIAQRRDDNDSVLIIAAVNAIKKARGAK